MSQQGHQGRQGQQGHQGRHRQAPPPSPPPPPMQRAQTQADRAPQSTHQQSTALQDPRFPPPDPDHLPPRPGAARFPASSHPSSDTLPLASTPRPPVVHPLPTYAHPEGPPPDLQGAFLAHHLQPTVGIPLAVHPRLIEQDAAAASEFQELRRHFEPGEVGCQLHPSEDVHQHQDHQQQRQQQQCGHAAGTASPPDTLNQSVPQLLLAAPDGYDPLLIGPEAARSAEERKKQNAQAEREAELSRKQKAKKTALRKRWMCCVRMMTCCCFGWCLSRCCKLRRKDAQTAWREKVAMCLIIFFVCTVLAFLIAGFSRIICPRQDVMSLNELSKQDSRKNPWVAAYGRAYKIDKLVSYHENLPSNGVNWNNEFSKFYGQEVSYLFDKIGAFDKYCPGIDSPTMGWSNILYKRPALFVRPIIGSDHRKSAVEYLNSMQQDYNFSGGYLVGVDLRNETTTKYHTIFVYSQKIGNRTVIEKVYDMTAYLNASQSFLGAKANQVFTSATNLQDITNLWNNVVAADNPGMSDRLLRCMDELFFVGVVDHRGEFQCQFSNWFIFAITVILVVVILFKFITGLSFSTADASLDDAQSKFVICLVPCYTESKAQLKRTFDSMAMLDFDNKRRLLFVVCDGFVIGSGNSRPTPEIVLDVLGCHTPPSEVLPQYYGSLGGGALAANRATVFSGLYSVRDRTMPYVVVAKCGLPSEGDRPGNRGKRDSQVILMRFLSRVHFDEPMSPLELELYRQMASVIGIPPFFFEYLLMIDADTEVFSNSLNRLVSYMEQNKSTAGVSGETLPANAKTSSTSMIQVYEYFISHHVAKAFESLFGSVTCLPGCFCMYRIRTSAKRAPLLIAPALVADYAENEVRTVHTRNLLHLGEDRYLTTLMMKHFPKLRLSFISEAKCRTYVPDRWSVLLSQRRRWINSTVHNLLELLFLPDLCGFCCFSMRFVVFIDLFSTVVQPIGILYIGYLVYIAIYEKTSVFPLASILMLVATYGLQAVVFLLKREASQIGWMIVYLLALPVYSLFLPIYSFWHFDDFSWGSTRIVVDAAGNKVMVKTDDETRGKDHLAHAVARSTWREYVTELGYLEKPALGEMTYGDQSTPDSDAHSSTGGFMEEADRQHSASAELGHPRPQRLQQYHPQAAGDQALRTSWADLGNFSSIQSSMFGEAFHSPWNASSATAPQPGAVVAPASRYARGASVYSFHSLMGDVPAVPNLRSRSRSPIPAFNRSNSGGGNPSTRSMSPLGPPAVHSPRSMSPLGAPALPSTRPMSSLGAPASFLPASRTGSPYHGSRPPSRPGYPPGSRPRSRACSRRTDLETLGV